MMDYNAWIREIHKNAVAHGWWDEKRTEDELMLLAVSEVSEALEEYRSGRPMVYALEIDADGEQRTVTDLAAIRAKNLKPEGIAAELVDCAIRCLDRIGADRVSWWFIGHDMEYLEHEAAAKTFAQIGARVTHELAKICDQEKYEDLVITHHALAAVYALAWVSAHSGHDAEELLRLKHEYNKTRSYRHGGKRL